MDFKYLRIKKVGGTATCGGSCSECETYKGHPEVEKWRDNKGFMSRHIPKNENVLLVNLGGKYFHLCKKHAVDFLADMKKQTNECVKQAKKLGWI